MLNHVWFALIAIGILTAAGRDISDAVTNAYGNGIPWECPLPDGVAAAGRSETTLRLSHADLARHFRELPRAGGDLSVRVTLMLAPSGGSALLAMVDSFPAPLRAVAEGQGAKTSIVARAAVTERNGARVLELRFDPVSFVVLRRITTAAFDAAGVAVQIALGLIGIMALWLGVMKVAEAAGLVTVLARAVRPLTARLFPDVPSDHPAVAAMMMNIAANMLGLGNAATPFGLKAMEELNRINPRAGTASNAMCTFLAMNTSCVTVIPATAIAVRAAAGSSNPALIIGTTFLASLTATIVAVTTAKLLQRLRVFRADRADAERA
jgi:spore maturation protein A